jgi:hypothetical protein
MKSGYCEGETSFICPHILDFFSGVVNWLGWRWYGLWSFFTKESRQLQLLLSLNHASSAFLIPYTTPWIPPLIIILFHCDLLFTSFIDPLPLERDPDSPYLLNSCYLLIDLWSLWFWERHGVLSSWMQSAWLGWAITLFFLVSIQILIVLIYLYTLILCIGITTENILYRSQFRYVCVLR